MIEYVLYDGKGIIDIKGTTDCTIFYHKGQSKILAWQMCWNTLFDFFVGSIPNRIGFDINKYYELVEKLEKGLLTEDKLHVCLRPILRLLINGTYRLSIVDYHKNTSILFVGEDKIYYPHEKRYEVSRDFYSGCEPFPFYAIQIQVNEKRVEYYVELIKNGNYPLPIIYKSTESDIKFIIDGHHKLQAYKKANKNIKAVLIEKVVNYDLEGKKIKRVYRRLTGEKEVIEQLNAHLEILI